MYQNKFFFYIFHCLYLLFALASTLYWNDLLANRNIIGEGANKGFLNYSYLLLVFICVFYLISKIYIVNKKGIHRICILWLVMMFLVFIYNRSSLFDLFSMILWPFIFETTYFFVSFDKSVFQKMHRFYFIILAIGLYFFFNIILFDNHVGQSNSVFFPFLTLPFLLCTKNKKHIILILVFFSVFGFLSLKRSIMLIIALLWIVYMFSFLNKSRHLLISLIISCFIIIGGGAVFYFTNNATGGAMVERATKKEDTFNGRNRGAIYLVTWDMIKNSSNKDLLIGHGHFGVYRDSPLMISAHNDFLEIIYDYGVLVFILYLGLWCYVIKRWVFLFKSKSEYLFAYTSSLLIFLVMSMVSHLVLYSSYFIYLVMFWGAIEGVIQNKDDVPSVNYKYI